MVCTLVSYYIYRIFLLDSSSSSSPKLSQTVSNSNSS
jgi:hypothetical protein